AVRHDEMAARGFTELVFLFGFRLHRYEEAHHAEQLAWAALERIGGNPELEVRLRMNIASALGAEGRLDEAIMHHERALVLAEKVFSPGDPELGTAFFRMGKRFRARGREEEALRFFTRALAARERSLGPSHPSVATTLNAIAEVHLDRGDY